MTWHQSPPSLGLAPNLPYHRPYHCQEAGINSVDISSYQDSAHLNTRRHVRAVRRAHAPVIHFRATSGSHKKNIRLRKFRVTSPKHPSLFRYKTHVPLAASFLTSTQNQIIIPLEALASRLLRLSPGKEPPSTQTDDLDPNSGRPQDGQQSQSQSQRSSPNEAELRQEKHPNFGLETTEETETG
jgi:hypothetical protein